MSERERAAAAKLPLPEFLDLCRAWMEANYPGWRYGAITGIVGDGVPMVVMPFTPFETSLTPPQPS